MPRPRLHTGRWQRHRTTSEGPCSGWTAVLCSGQLSVWVWTQDSCGQSAHRVPRMLCSSSIAHSGLCKDPCAGEAGVHPTLICWRAEVHSWTERPNPAPLQRCCVRSFPSPSSDIPWLRLPGIGKIERKDDLYLRDNLNKKCGLLIFILHSLFQRYYKAVLCRIIQWHSS